MPGRMLISKVKHCSNGVILIAQRRICIRSTNFSGEEPVDERALRAKILEASSFHINQFGWTKYALIAGAESCQLPGTLHALFDDPKSSLAFYVGRKFNKRLREESTRNHRQQDESTSDYLLKHMRNRLEMVEPLIDKWPEAIAIFAHPSNALTSANMLLRMCDDLWYFAGDRSTSIAWYSKRIPLMGIYSMSQLYMMQDKSINYEDTWNFMQRSLDELQHAGKTVKQVRDGISLFGNMSYSTVQTVMNMLRIN